ncbi:MAG: hypothetical protein NT061_10135 [Spirochaetes bacterium]|nr:hypothetical protein [Spirochaetota bacterium]
MRNSYGLGAFFLAAIIGLSSCSMPGEAEAPASDEGLADAVFTDFSREEIVKGIVTFTAKAVKAEYFKDQGRLVVYQAVFEDRGEEGGAVEFSGEADTVVWHEDTGDAELSGFVRLYSKAENASFETSSIKYHKATNTVEGEAGDTVIVRVGEELLLRGMGFFADIGKKAFTFRQGAQGVIEVGDSNAGKGVMQ